MHAYRVHTGGGKRPPPPALVNPFTTEKVKRHPQCCLVITH
nr:MAG TPA: hypothetical protein [Caudoviricetes sp.]